ncbi:hypothetical protein SUNI508_02620 [Seiridium unicorne]|uniref:RRM domain-containing protein n=1 Tax=Seiridium unicorne TaxID=138068 RepID=A0ABR2UG08_9PEZI
MTDNPELVATADLTPESPKPINLSSPASVPALQDQADNLSTMALSPSEDVSIAGITNVIQDLDATGHVQTQTQAEENATTSPSGETHISTNASDTAQGTQEHEVVPEVENEDEDDYAKDFDSPVPGTDDAAEDASADTGGNVATNDPLKTEFSPSPSKDAITSASQPTPPSASLSVSVSGSAAGDGAGTASRPTTDNHEVIQNGEAYTTETTATPQAEAEDAIDIQALVDNITARHDATKSSDAAAAVTGEPAPGTNPAANPQSSLPPKPPVSQQPPAANLRPDELRRYQSNASASIPNVTPAAASPYSYPPPGASVPANYAAPHMYPNPGPPMPLPASYTAAPPPGANGSNLNQSQRYDDFLKEERKYVSEAKWDRFPEGSRLFIGNLSSERVQKKEVFDIFSRYGKLAQISLKQAYGFVQYHTVAEGQAATDALQGIEISGRKIHLEYSRTQKKEGDGDRRGNRGGRGGNNQNERSNRFDGRRGDGYRPRSPSPSRGAHSRQASYGRADRGHWDPPADYQRRGRSRSPIGYGAGATYRHRSPSPYRRGPPTSEVDLDIPRRFGADVPDVQLLLLEEVHRDFVGWVQGAFVERGLKVEVMYLNPRFPRDLVIQRQVVEGVYGVAELDFRSQTAAKIPLQTFDRSAGRHNARFDQYQDLEPRIAAEIIARAKSQGQLQSPAGYGNGQYPPVNYPQAQMPPQSYPQMPGQPPANLNLGGLDNATLQRVLSAVQGGPQAGMPGQPQMGAAPGVDVNAVLSVLGANGAIGTPTQHQPVSYHPAPASGNPADQAHVQNIMAQLSRYRQ